jgi:hypothetical protein
MRSLRVLHTTLIFLLLPALALASGGGEEGASLKAQGYYLINFVVFVGILWFLLKDRLGAGLGRPPSHHQGGAGPGRPRPRGGAPA